jgi:hypothetical protein
VDGLPPGCPKGQWCWVNPLPTGNRINAVWGSSPSDVFAVGDAGTILRWNGASWSPIAWAQREGLYAAWGSGPKDVYFVGENGVVVHYDGGKLAVTSLSGGTSLFAIWGSGPQDVFAVGEGGLVAHFDGTTWSQQTVNPATALFAVVGDSTSGKSGDVYAAGMESYVYRLNRSMPPVAWQPGVKVDKSAYPATIRAGWGAPNDFVFAGEGGMIWRGSVATWSSLRPEWLFASIHGIWGKSVDALWMVGSASLLSYNGISIGDVGTVTTTDRLDGVWGDGTDLLLVGGGGSILRYHNATLASELPATQVTARAINAVWGRSPGEIYAVGEKGTILRYDGVAWQQQPSAAAGGADLSAVSGVPTPGGPVVAVGKGGTIVRLEAGGWVKVAWSGTTGLNAVWATAPDRFHIVGDAGASMTTLKLDAAGVAPVSTSGPALDLNGVFGLGPQQVYAAGAEGIVMRFDGTTWSKIASLSEPLTAIWARSASDLYVVGEYGQVFHFDGASWTPQDPQVSSPNAVWGDATSVYVSGDHGGVSRSVGAGWTLQPTNCGNEVRGIWGGSTIWAVGEAGTILRYEP